MNIGLALSLILSLYPPGGNQRINFKGVWIPKNIDWRSPRFRTFCIVDDSTAIVLSSIQARKRDSILFNATGPLTVEKGKITTITPGLFLLSFAPRMSNGEGPNALVTLKLQMVGDQLYIAREMYQRAFPYTQASKEIIYQIVIGQSASP